MEALTKFELRGADIRTFSKALVLEFMRSMDACQPGKGGITQAQIFKQCGFDWGDYPVAVSTKQQFWVAAILWELSSEGKVERVEDSGPWRLKY